MKQKMKPEIKHMFFVDVVWVMDVVPCSVDGCRMDSVSAVNEDVVKLCGGMYVEVEEELKDL